MSNNAGLAAAVQAPRQAPFLLHLFEDEQRASDPVFLMDWLRVGERHRSEVIENCVVEGVLGIFMPFLLLWLPLTIIETFRELRRIKEKRLLIAGGRILNGAVLDCQGKRKRGPHEDSDYYYEVAVRYSFQTPEGL